MLWRQDGNHLRCSAFDAGSGLAHSLLHLFGAHIANVRGRRPTVAERILELAIAIAPEHVRKRHGDLRSRVDRAPDERVHVVDIEVNGDRRTLESLWADCAVIGKFVDQHDRRITDPDHGMHKLSVGTRHSGYFHRLERSLVKLDRSDGAGAGQVRRHGMHTFRDRLYLGQDGYSSDY